MILILVWWIHFEICDIYLEPCGLDISDFMLALLWITPIQKKTFALFSLIVVLYHTKKDNRLSKTIYWLVPILSALILVIFPAIELNGFIHSGE